MLIARIRIHGRVSIKFGAEIEALTPYFDDPDGNVIELKGPSNLNTR